LHLNIIILKINGIYSKVIQGVFLGKLWYLFLYLLAVLRLSNIDLLKSPHRWGALPNYSLYIELYIVIYIYIYKLHKILHALPTRQNEKSIYIFVVVVVVVV